MSGLFSFFFCLVFFSKVSVDISTFLMSKMFCSIVVWLKCVVFSKNKSSLGRIHLRISVAVLALQFFHRLRLRLRNMADLAGPEGAEQELWTFLE